MGMDGSCSGIWFNRLEHIEKEDIRSFFIIYLSMPKKNVYLVKGTEPEISILFPSKSLGISERTNLESLSLFSPLFARRVILKGSIRS